MDYFFDNQLKRYLLTFMRTFSSIKVRNGPDTNGLFSISQVPILYGDPSYIAAQIIKGASENTMLPSPMFSAWIENVKLNDQRRQDSQYVGTVSTIEREFNQQTQTYGSGPGVRQTVERYMPVPYDFFFRLDVWTTNINTKLQIFEQIVTIFNKSLQLQQNSNILDWTSIFELWLEETIWTNRSIGQLTGDERDVMSFKFKVQGWINPPAKLKRSSLITEIVTQIHMVDDIQNIAAKIDGEYDPFRTCIDTLPIQIVDTVGNYKISVSKGIGPNLITLLNEYGQIDPSLSWFSLIQKYGQITPNITKIRLKLDPNLDITDTDIIGGIVQDPVNQNILFFTPDIDTLPQTNMAPILDIIDPSEMWPGHQLPSVSAGQRYLLASSNSQSEEPAIPDNVHTSPWGQFLVAYTNDIIEYNGISWVVSFNSRAAIGKSYVINNSNGAQYTFFEGQWSYTYFGTYSAGLWRIDNIIQAPNGITVNNYE